MAAASPALTHPTDSCSAALTSAGRSRAGLCTRTRWAATTCANRVENDGPSGIVQVTLLTCATPASDKSPGCIPHTVPARATLHKCFFCTNISFAQAFPLHRCFLCTGAFLPSSSCLSASLPLFTALVPNARWCLLSGPIPCLYKGENFPQCLGCPSGRVGRQNLDLSISNGAGWVQLQTLLLSFFPVQ